MLKKILSNAWVKEQIIQWGLYACFGKRPNWKDADQTRRFLIANERPIIFIVKLTRTNVDDKFAELYSHVINNRILFDSVYGIAAKIWEAPETITQGLIINKDESIDKDDLNFRERIKARIQERKYKGESVAEVEKAKEPESIMAVITVIGVFVNVAQLILKFREYRRNRG